MKRRNRQVVPIQIPQRELLLGGILVDVELLLNGIAQAFGVGADFFQLVRAEVEDEPISRRNRRVHHRGVFMGAPVVEAKDDVAAFIGEDIEFIAAMDEWNTNQHTKRDCR